jgi:hypothetical protein
MDNILCEFKTEDWVNFECINCGMKIRAEQPQNDMPIFVCGKPVVSVSKIKTLILFNSV